MSQHQALNHRSTTNYGSTDTRVELKDTESDDDNYQSAPKFKLKLNEVRSMNDFCLWLTTDTWSKINVIFFYISILVPFILAFYYFTMHEYATSYVVAGIYGICASLYGMNHFRTLFNLKNEIDSYTNLNGTFRKQRLELNEDIKQLHEGTKELKTTHNHLHMSNLKMIDMIRKFESLEDQLDALNVSNNEKLTAIGDRADKLRHKYYHISLQQQRNLLWKLFDRLERKGVIKQGITKEEYKEFYNLLPKEYQDRFDRLGGFKGLLTACGTSSNNQSIDVKHFESALSVYAKMHVDNADVVFKLDAKTRKVTILSETRQSGLYFSKYSKETTHHLQ
eukprot:297629_1